MDAKKYFKDDLEATQNIKNGKHKNLATDTN